jgi:hypothetical protein
MADEQKVNGVNWHTVVTAVAIALSVSAFVLYQHSAFPHKDAAHKTEIILIHAELRTLRVEIASLTNEVVKLRESMAAVRQTKCQCDPDE